MCAGTPPRENFNPRRSHVNRNPVNFFFNRRVFIRSEPFSFRANDQRDVFSNSSSPGEDIFLIPFVITAMPQKKKKWQLIRRPEDITQTPRKAPYVA